MKLTPHIITHCVPSNKGLPSATREDLLQEEIDLALLRFHPGDLNAYAIAEPETASPAIAHQRVLPLPELVIVIAEGVYMNQPIHEIVIEKHEESECHDSRDSAREVITQVPPHEFDLLEIDRIPFRLSCRLLARTGPFRHGVEFFSSP